MAGPGGSRGLPPRLLRGDCIEEMAGLEEASVDGVVCDPPYGIGYQNERWDSGAIREAAAGRGRSGPTMNQALEIWCGMWGRSARG
jgi:DNA modification methylase